MISGVCLVKNRHLGQVTGKSQALFLTYVTPRIQTPHLHAQPATLPLPSRPLRTLGAASQVGAY